MAFSETCVAHPADGQGHGIDHAYRRFTSNQVIIFHLTTQLPSIFVCIGARLVASTLFLCAGIINKYCLFCFSVGHLASSSHL